MVEIKKNTGSFSPDDLLLRHQPGSLLKKSSRRADVARAWLVFLKIQAVLAFEVLFLPGILHIFVLNCVLCTALSGFCSIYSNDVNFV